MIHEKANTPITQVDALLIQAGKQSVKCYCFDSKSIEYIISFLFLHKYMKQIIQISLCLGR